jgi:hypothetical protein
MSDASVPCPPTKRSLMPALAAVARASGAVVGIDLLAQCDRATAGLNHTTITTRRGAHASTAHVDPTPPSWPDPPV